MSSSVLPNTLLSSRRDLEHLVILVNKDYSNEESGGDRGVFPTRVFLFLFLLALSVRCDARQEESRASVCFPAWSLSHLVADSSDKREEKAWCLLAWRLRVLGTETNNEVDLKG